MGPIRLLLADDHEAMLDRVADLVAFECDVNGTAIDGRQALDAAKYLKPDVLVLDISMPAALSSRHIVGPAELASHWP